MNPDVNIQAKRRRIALIALFVLPLSGLMIDIFVPSLPNIAQHFNAPKSFAQLTITFYMIGMGVMQLFAGAISDSYGRKKPFMIAMALNIVVTLLIPFSSHIGELLFLRLMQGIVVGLLIVPIRAIFADLFVDKAFHKMTAYATLTWSIGPIVAPVIGGYLQHYFGWQSTFYFLAIYSIIGFVLIGCFAPETSAFRHPFGIVPLLKRYREILSSVEYIRALLINGILYSIVILFAVVGSFIIQKVLLFSPIQFGHMALLTGFAWFLGTMTNRFLIHFDPKQKSIMCLGSLLILSIISWIVTVTIPLNIYTIMVPTFILIYVGGIAFPNNYAQALSLFPKINASANAFFGAFLFLIPGAASAIGTLLKSNSAIPLMTTYMILIIFSIIIYFLGNLFIARKQSDSPR